MQTKKEHITKQRGYLKMGWMQLGTAEKLVQLQIGQIDIALTQTVDHTNNFGGKR